MNSASRVFGYDDSSLDESERRVLERARENAARNTKTWKNSDSSDEFTGYAAEYVEYDPFEFAVIPGVFLPEEYPNVNFGLGSIYIANERVRGLQLSGVVGVIKKEFSGIQISGFMNKLDGKGSGAMIGGALNLAKSDFRGVQYAGFANLNTGNMRGTQIAGFMNRVSGDLAGMQVAGFLNIAGNVQGSQFGIVNIADSCTGASFGLFNYIKNGINSFSVYFENDQLGFQYQGGTNAFFTTFLANINDFGDDYKYSVLGYGIGSKFGGGFINFDLELLGKYILDMNYLETQYKDRISVPNLTKEEKEAIRDEAMHNFSKRFYPSARITANMRFGKHFGIFASFNADLRVSGWNDKAFDYWDKEMFHYDFPVAGNNCTVRAYWTVGIKL